MKKSLLIIMALITLTGAALAVTLPTFAANNSNYASIIDRIAAKFNLEKTQVQQVFDEEREARQKERLTELAAKLGEEVKNGKITEKQKQLILAKHEEVRKQRESTRGQNQNLTAEERKAQMAAERESLEKWAKDNDVDLYYFFRFGGEGKGKRCGAGPGPEMERGF